MMRYFEKAQDMLLLASVFITGAAVLVVEITATRILSPYFGNTIYTTSSVIGTILAALSLGYYVGGKLVDYYPSRRVFYAIIFVAGLLVAFIQLLQVNMLPDFSAQLSIRFGSLLASLTIFFLPGFALGLFSPFAIVLYQQGQGQLGSRSGKVFFWSTLGSIAGSLLAGFYLIPHFGIARIMFATAAVLCAWGLLGLIASHVGRKSILLAAGAMMLVAATVWAWYPEQQEPWVLYEKDGVYEKIKITEGVWEGQPARFLFQDRSYSAAMYLHSDELVYEYTKYYALHALHKPVLSRALVIGGGAYSIPKAIMSDFPSAQVDVAEIEPELFDLAKQYFNLPDSGRLQNFLEDGRVVLGKNQDPYDLIVVDAYYSLFSVPISLTTREFFTLAKNNLSEDGVFVGNFAGDILDKPPSFILSEIKTFMEVFDNSYFFAVRSPSYEKPQNIIFFGVNGDRRVDFSSRGVVENKNPVIRSLGEKHIDISGIDFSRYQTITDDFAPVEYLVGRLIDYWQQ